MQKNVAKNWIVVPFSLPAECAYGDQDFIDDSEFKQEEHKDDLDFKPPGTPLSMLH